MSITPMWLRPEIGSHGRSTGVMPWRPLERSRLPMPNGPEVESSFGGGERAENNPPRHERADRVERDVAQVEQACEADHDVEPEGHHHERERRDHRVVEVLAEGVLPDDAEQDRDRQEDQQPGPARQHLRHPLQARAELEAGLLARLRSLVDGGHPSLVSSPKRPPGLKTMIRIRIANTTAGAHAEPFSSRDSAVCWTIPMIRPPMTAPLRLPMPPMTADVNAIRPAVKPWLKWTVRL